MRNRTGRRAHSDQSLPRTRYEGVRGPKRRGASPRMSHLPRRLRRSSARPLDRLTQREGAYPSWTAIGRAGLDPSGRSGSGMDPPGFSARNAGKSQKLTRLSPEHPSEWKASEGVLGQLDPNHLLRSHIAATPTSTRVRGCRPAAPSAAAPASSTPPACRRAPSCASWSVPCARSPAGVASPGAASARAPPASPAPA